MDSHRDVMGLCHTLRKGMIDDFVGRCMVGTNERYVRCDSLCVPLYVKIFRDIGYDTLTPRGLRQRKWWIYGRGWCLSCKPEGVPLLRLGA